MQAVFVLYVARHLNSCAFTHIVRYLIFLHLALLEKKACTYTADLQVRPAMPEQRKKNLRLNSDKSA